EGVQCPCLVRQLPAFPPGHPARRSLRGRRETDPGVPQESALGPPGLPRIPCVHPRPDHPAGFPLAPGHPHHPLGAGPRRGSARIALPLHSQPRHRMAVLMPRGLCAMAALAFLMHLLPGRAAAQRAENDPYGPASGATAAADMTGGPETTPVHADTSADPV